MLQAQVYNSSSFEQLKQRELAQLKVELDSHHLDATFQIISSGNYVHYLRNWYDAFGADNVLVLGTENLISTPAEELRLFENFFGLDSYFTEAMFQRPNGSNFYCVEKDEAEMWYKKFVEYPFQNRQFAKMMTGQGLNKSLSCLGAGKRKTRGMAKTEDVTQAIENLHEFYRPLNRDLFAELGTSVLQNPF